MTVPITQVKADFKAVLFDYIDKDGNGILDVKELENFKKRIQQYVEHGGNHMALTALSTSSNMATFTGEIKFEGAITFDEYWASVMRTNGCSDEASFAEKLGYTSLEDWAGVMERLKEALGQMTVPITQVKADFKAILFDNIDEDGNGNLDVKELKDVITKLRDGNKGDDDSLIQILTKADLDANGDGVITFDELWASMIKMNGCEDEDAFAESPWLSCLSVEDWEWSKERLKADLV
jgi:Ca2+-binding EF-hand superfamily protein